MRSDAAPAPKAEEQKQRGFPSPARSEAPKAGNHAIAGPGARYVVRVARFRYEPGILRLGP